MTETLDNQNSHIEAKKISDEIHIKIDKTKILYVIIGITLILTLVNSYQIFLKDGSTTGNVVNNPPSPSPTPTQAPAKVDVNVEGASMLGNKGAKVTIVEFSDYQCPFCGKHFSDTYPLIKRNYIDTGKVKLYFKDFPLTSIHPEAQKAAEAARCVKEQKGDDGYWKMHDKLFSNQGSLSVDNEKKWARELDVDGNKFDDCLNSGKYAGAVQKDLQEGSSYGVQGTPAFFVNGKLLTGAQPYEVFRSSFEQELNS